MSTILILGSVVSGTSALVGGMIFGAARDERALWGGLVLGVVTIGLAYAAGARA